MLWLREKNIWSYFNLQPNNEIVEISDDLLKSPINLTGINLFTECLPTVDIIDIIKANWNWFVFITKYFGNEKEIYLLSEKCEVVEKFTSDIDEVYWIVYECDF